MGLLGRGHRRDVHPVEPRDDRGCRARGADPGVGAGVAVAVALMSSPSVGIVLGGLIGPFAGLLVPKPTTDGGAPAIEADR